MHSALKPTQTLSNPASLAILASTKRFFRGEFGKDFATRFKALPVDCFVWNGDTEDMVVQGNLFSAFTASTHGGRSSLSYQE